MAINKGPVVMDVQGDEFIKPARILAILWEGSTGIGNTIEVVQREEADPLIWPCRTNAVNTYLGVSFATEGVDAPNGFKLKTHQNGRVMVYLREG